MTEKFSFEVIGEGQPLVCLHAYALDHTEWMDAAKILKPRFTMILPDIRGHGGSPSPEADYTVDELAEDIIAILDQLEIERANIAGHSMGGYIALALARNYPSRVSGLALVASHAFADSPEKKRSRLEEIEKVRAQGPQGVLERMPENLSDEKRVQEFCREKINHMGRNGVIGVLAAMASRLDSMDFLRLFDKPLGIIAGTKDHFIPLETSREMARILDPEVYVEIENSGHMPMMEDPEEVAKALNNLFQL